MSEYAVVPTGNPIEHPALKGWKALQLTPVVPERIEVLKKQRRAPVYKLKGVGPEGADVVAKRSLLTSARVEYTIYEKILPLLPIPSLSYYGFYEEDNSEYGWNYLAYTNAGMYSPQNAAHRVLAAKWLGILHTAAIGVAAGIDLPDRGPRYYLGRLRSAQSKISQHLENPALTPNDTAVLKDIVHQCELVESKWSTIEEICKLLPPTLIHGDFATKNIRVLAGPGAPVLQPFDWGSAGWGSMAIDLAQAGMLPNDYWSSPDLASYHAAVRELCPQLKLDSLERIAISGKIFRCLCCIDGDAESLAFPWVEKCMAKMQMYMMDMEEALQAAKGVI